MNKNLNKNPYDLKEGDKVLLQKFFSSKHLEFTNAHHKAQGEIATFLGFKGYRDRQAVVALFDGVQLYWRTESLRYVKQHTQKEIEEIIGYGTIEPVESSVEKHRTTTTLTGGLQIIPTPHKNIILYGKVEIPDSNEFPPSEAYIQAESFKDKVITRSKALEILQDPQAFLKELETSIEESDIYPEFDKLVDITNPYDILKELVRLKNLYNSSPGSSFDYIISFGENNTGHKIITVKLKDFTRSIFTFNSENKAKKFLEKNGEYLKIISKMLF